MFWTIVGAILFVIIIILAVPGSIILLGWILEDEDRKRKAKNVLIALAIILFIIIANIYG